MKMTDLLLEEILKNAGTIVPSTAYKNLSLYDLFELEKDHPEDFDYKKAFEVLVYKDRVGNFIDYAGEKWKEFDYEKGLDALINLSRKDSKNLQFVYDAGKYWKEFNSKKGFQAILDYDTTGVLIFGAAWKNGWNYDFRKDFSKEAVFNKMVANIDRPLDCFYIGYHGQTEDWVDMFKMLEKLLEVDKTNSFVKKALAGWSALKKPKTKEQKLLVKQAKKRKRTKR